jgi:hypothetical protein
MSFLEGKFNQKIIMSFLFLSSFALSFSAVIRKPVAASEFEITSAA